MKNKILKVIMFLIIILMLMQIKIFALTLNVKSNKKDAIVGDKIKVTVSWNEGMQAADYSLKYDKEKLDYLKSSIDDVYVSDNEETGDLKTAWFSMDNKDLKEITYIFKVKKSGTAEFSTKINGGFATGELEVPKSYELGNLKLEIGERIIQRIIRIIVRIIIIIIILLVLKKILNKKKHKKKVKFK